MRTFGLQFQLSSAIFQFLIAFLVKKILNEQNDTFSHEQNDKNSPVLIDTYDSSVCFVKISFLANEMLELFLREAITERFSN